VATKNKTSNKSKKQQTDKHSLFAFMRHKEKTPESFEIGKFDHVNLKAGNVKFKSLYGHNSL
jgi:hypothetical protein